MSQLTKLSVCTIAACFTAFGCDSPTESVKHSDLPGTAFAVTTNELVPIREFVHNKCTGEVVLIWGEAHVVVRSQLDGDGRFLVGFTTNFARVKGMGQSNGILYFAQSVEAAGEFSNVKPPYPSTVTEVLRARLVAQGAWDDLLITSKLHVTINALGEMTASDVDPESIECFTENSQEPPPPTDDVG